MRAVFGFAALLVVAADASGQSLYDDVPPLIPLAACEETGRWSEHALERILVPQTGLPPVPYPEDNPPTVEKIELGRKLFFDRRLSINKTMSCAMCHVPEQAFVHWEILTAVGVEGRSGKRNAPTNLNVAFYETLFHDGRDPMLETQYLVPLTAHHEMANPSAGGVIALLNALPDYQEMFQAAFAAPASVDRMGMALATYQRSLTAANTPFDRWYYAGDTEAMDADAQRGFALFTGKAECASCHLIDDDHALFTDQQFHDTGHGWLQERRRQMPVERTLVQVAPGVYHPMPQTAIDAFIRVREADLGRYEVTEDPDDRWKFRTPSLRNVAMTRPYMHDGALASLEEVVAFYNQGGAGHPEQDPRIRPLGLDAGETADLVAFLEALTSPDLACLAAGARVNPPDNH